MEAGLAYAKAWLQNRAGDIRNDHAKSKWDTFVKQFPDLDETLSRISMLEFPYSEPAKTEISQLVEGSANQWTHPSLYTEYKVVRCVKKLKNCSPQFEIDGANNIWIMKPSFSSRGNGVHCLNSTKEAFTRGKKMQAKVIQKYIESPFLLLLPSGNGKLEKRKFDIRQWVLVTSFNPVEIYMFGSCYLRLCGTEFSLGNIKDKFAHISNYSIQKNNIKVEDVKHDLIMSLTQFLSHLKSAHNM